MPDPTAPPPIGKAGSGAVSGAGSGIAARIGVRVVAGHVDDAAALVDADLGAGSHVQTWDGRDEGGRECASGLYLARLSVDDGRQAVYREAQLALRAVVGTVDLDTLLGDKDRVAGELEESIRERAAAFGIQVVSLGIRDIILPGDRRLEAGMAVVYMASPQAREQLERLAGVKG